MLSKICPRCQRVMDYNKRLCDECLKVVGTPNTVRMRIYRESLTEEEKKRMSIYNTSRWKSVRARIVRRDLGLCVVCLNSGKRKFIDIVHHIIELKDDTRRAYDEKNLIGVCDKCHKGIHNEYDKGVTFKMAEQKKLFGLIGVKSQG